MSLIIYFRKVQIINGSELKCIYGLAAQNYRPIYFITLYIIQLFHIQVVFINNYN